MSKTRYYKLENPGGDAFIKNNALGCHLVQFFNSGETRIGTYNVPYNKHQGDIIQDSNSKEFISAFNKAVSKIQNS